MGIPEGQAALDQVVGQVGGGGKALGRGLTHALGAHLDAGGHVGKEAQRGHQGVHGVEERLLVFLVVLVVGQRLSLHQRQQRHQVAIDATGLAADQLGHVGVLLLRHDRRAGAVAVRQVDEADPGRHPVHQLFREARQVHHQQAGVGAELDGEVAIGDGVQRVLAYAIETQRARHVFAVDGEGGAGQRGSSQRQPVDAAAGVGQAPGIARQHLHIGQQVVAEGDRLSHLQVGEAGHDRVGMLLGQRQQRFLQCTQQGQDLVGGVTQPQANVGGDLVVARAGRVQALAGVADQLGQALLDVEVDILQIQRPLEAAGGDLLTNGCKTTLD